MLIWRRWCREGQVACENTTDGVDCNAAGEIRTKDASDFTALEKEQKQGSLTPLSKQLDTWGDMHASTLKLKNASSVAQALFVLVPASTISSADAIRLTALIQGTKSAETDGEDRLGAPAA